MKTVSLVLSAVLVLGLVVVGSNNVAYPSDWGWYAAGGALAGLVVGSAIANSSRPRYCYYDSVYDRPVYVRPASYYSPVRYYQPYYPVSRYDNYNAYSYRTSPWTSATVYEHEIVQTW